MSFTVGKCCFCASLRAGAISIACIWLLGDCLFLTGTSLLTYRFDVGWQSRPEGGSWSIIRIGPSWEMIVYDTLYSVAILLDMMLLMGTITGRRILLNCWMVGYAVLYLVILLACAVLPVLPVQYRSSSSAGLLLHAGLLVYFWIVVRSYYLELGQQQSEGTPTPTAGKVFNTVPTGDVPSAAQDTYCEAGGFTMLPTALPPCTCFPKQQPCYFHNEKVLIAGSSVMSPSQSSISLD